MNNVWGTSGFNTLQKRHTSYFSLFIQNMMVDIAVMVTLFLLYDGGYKTLFNDHISYTVYDHIHDTVDGSGVTRKRKIYSI